MFWPSFFIGGDFSSTLYRLIASWCACNQSFVIFHSFHLVYYIIVISIVQTHSLEDIIFIA